MTHASKPIAALLLSAVLIAPGVGPAPAQAEQKPDDDKVLAGPTDKSQDQPEGRRFDGSRRKGDKHGRMQRLLKELNLTEDQKNQAQQILKQQHESWKSWKSEHQTELDEIKRQMKELHEKRRKLMESAPKRGEGLEKLRPILDADQQKKLDAIIKKHKDRHDKRSRHHDRRGGDDRPSDRRRKPSTDKDDELKL